MSLDWSVLISALLGFPAGSAVENPSASAGDLGLMLAPRRSPRGESGTPIHFSFLRHPTDRGNLQATVHGVAKSQADWVLSTHTCRPLGHYRTFSITPVLPPLDASNTFSHVVMDKMSSVIATWPLDGKNCPQLRKTDYWSSSHEAAIHLIFSLFQERKLWLRWYW